MPRSIPVNLPPRLGDFYDRPACSDAGRHGWLRRRRRHGRRRGCWLRAIALVTNAVWLHTLSAQTLAAVGLEARRSGWWRPPALGGLVIGLMALWLREDTRPRHSRGERGHPHRRQLFAARRPPSSNRCRRRSRSVPAARSAPSGPIIMTGGAVGSLFAQCFHHRRRAQGAAGRRCDRGYDGDLRNPGRRRPACRRNSPVRAEAAQPDFRDRRLRGLVGTATVADRQRRAVLRSPASSICRGGDRLPASALAGSRQACNRDC